LGHEIRNESHPIDLVWQERGQFDPCSLVRNEPSLNAALSQQSEVVPGQDRFAAETGGGVRRYDYNFHLGAVENTKTS
jgi:hypothetical protein